MKIAYLVNQYPCVSHTFIRREIAALEAQGHMVERYTVRPPPADLVDPADRAEALRTHGLLNGGWLALVAAVLAMAVARPLKWAQTLAQALNLARHGDAGLLRHLAYFAEACVLARRLGRSGVVHLHAHFGTNPAAVALLTRLLGGPSFSFTVHGPEEFDRARGLALAAKTHEAAFVVAVSEFGRSQLFRWLPLADWPKVHVVRCGVDAGFLEAGPRPPALASRLVCVGRLCEQKGQLLLLEAAAQLAGEGIPFELVLAGDGPMRRAVEDRIRDLNLGNRVRITGWLSGEQVRDELLAARALVLPSFAEGLPVVLMESMALGRPALTTYIAGIPELVQDGQCGWLVPAGSVSSLAAAMREVLAASKDQLAALGRTAAQRAAQRHDAAREAGKLADLIATAIGADKSPTEVLAHDHNTERRGLAGGPGIAVAAGSADHRVLGGPAPAAP